MTIHSEHTVTDSMEGQANHSSSRFYRIALPIVQLVWFLILFSTTLLLVAAIPARYAELNQVAAELVRTSGTLGVAEAAVLSELGLSVSFFAAYVTLFEALAAFSGIIVGAIIFWRQRRDWMAIYVSILLITLGTFVPPLGTAVLQQQPAFAPLITFLQFIAVGPSLLIFYLFPDGRFVPRWTVYVGALWLAYSVSWLIFPEFKPPITFFAIQSASHGVMLLILGLILTAIYSQFYRYHRVSTPLQRQQTKWVLFGFSIVLFTVVLVGLASRLVTFTPPSRTSLLFLLVAIPFVMLGLMVSPVAVMFSILKFRLWEIDILVRRTVTYAVLAALLAIVYFASIILFQQVFASVTGQRSEIATVLSTLAIAALFIPLRNRIQEVIDRHFNRKKYNAQKVMEKFGAAMRDETDLDKLTGELLNVVQETMQPKSVSVWLKQDRRPKTVDRKG